MLVSFYQITANPLLIDKMLLLWILKMLGHWEGSVVRNLLEIRKNNLNIKILMQSHCMFLYLLHVLAMYSMVYFHKCPSVTLPSILVHYKVDLLYTVASRKILLKWDDKETSMINSTNIFQHCQCGCWKHSELLSKTALPESLFPTFN